MISEKTWGKTTTDKVVKKMRTKHTIGGKSYLHQRTIALGNK